MAQVLALLTLATLSVSAGPASAANYEPNDSISSAAGPLLGSQSYLAGLETPTDADYYYFYVTSPEAAVNMTVEDIGGGSAGAEMDAAVTDALGTPLTGATYIHQGEARSLTVELPPQKYFLQVTAVTGSGESYRITTRAGALGTYSAIAARCGSARAATERAKAAVRRARVDLQRAVGRLRLSRYASQETRRRARRHLRRIRSSIRKRKAALRMAGKSQEPWCSIPQ